jgi:hypothetical protein
LKRLIRKSTRTLLVVAFLVVGASLVIFSHDSIDASSTQAAEPGGWGREVLSQVYTGLSSLSPISLANACGLGASSCFKCHNGKRAGAANMDSEKAPWHNQHARVNNSCASCHKGNPRLMKEKMAHNHMIGDPRNNIQQACSTCHSGTDLDALSRPYYVSAGEQ